MEPDESLSSQIGADLNLLASGSAGAAAASVPGVRHPSAAQAFWAAAPNSGASGFAGAAAAFAANLSAGVNGSGRSYLHRPVQSAILYLVLACSLVSLVAFLTVYRSVAQLRNRAGFILCWHASCLLVVELLHLAGRSVALPQPVCLTSLLASFLALTGTFAWAAVFGIDLLISIGSRTVRPSRETRWGYARLSAFVWLMPALLTAALAALHFRFGLLNNRRCDAASAKQWLMVGLSVVPLGLSLLINLAVLGALCAMLLLRSRQAARSIGRRAAASQSRLAIVTLKVSVILGVTWLPYFCIAKILGRGREPVTSFVAEVIVDLHGCLLSACFCLNRKTRARLAETCARRRTSRRMSAQAFSAGKQRQLLRHARSATAASGSSAQCGAGQIVACASEIELHERRSLLLQPQQRRGTNVSI